MDSDLREIIISFNDAPEPIQQAIYYDEVADLAKELIAKWGLLAYQQVTLENIITLLLLGFIQGSALNEQLQDSLAVDGLVSEGIVADLEDKLLEPLLQRIDIPQEILLELDSELEQEITSLENTPETTLDEEPAPEAATGELTPLAPLMTKATLENSPPLTPNPSGPRISFKDLPVPEDTPELGDPANSYVAHPENKASDRLATAKNTPGLRTMAKDMNRAKADFILDTGETSYQSEQPDFTSTQE